MTSRTEALPQELAPASVKETYYLVDVMGCVDPEVIGPFATDEERDAAARTTRDRQDEEDALFWLDVREGVPVIGAYTAGFFLDDDDGDGTCSSCGGALDEVTEGDTDGLTVFGCRDCGRREDENGTSPD